jgi:hypothetical protein
MLAFLARHCQQITAAVSRIAEHNAASTVVLDGHQAEAVHKSGLRPCGAEAGLEECLSPIQPPANGARNECVFFLVRCPVPVL